MRAFPSFSRLSCFQGAGSLLGPAGRGCPAATHFYRNPQSGFSLFAKGALRARGLLTSRSEVTQTPKVSKRKATLVAASLRFATGNLRCSVQPGSR